ncbi:hypothetical protein [Adhaeribacter rhizoryzae]|uniref:Protein BatD n=1 Tax=Adhaeribacter rhizoryzae TaxID=2607907 RepID=A0A5M6CY73_9BACT|nr:hypothetical protein [Adhaeribacter rhizoryzae]KAA5539370.1 hypothetical protein F0145_24515 [Adhaeribacter rhizoryzae]
MLKKIFFFITLLPLFGLAQTPESNLPQGLFQDDSVKIGQEINFLFYYRHPATEEIIFPDSTYNFAPFEFVSRQYFPTRTRNNLSRDSVVYTLRTFSIAPVQTLALPIFKLQNQDTLQIKAQPAEIYLKQLVKGPANLAQLKAQTQLAPIPERVNFAYWLIASGILVLVAVLVWILFGRKIIIQYRLYILKKDHNSFINKFNAYIEKFNKSESLQIVEQAITLWKNYLTNLEGNAINSFTTREIAAYYNDDEDVTTALRLFDKAIYGNIVSDKSSETIIAFFLLHHFADRRYEFVKDLTKYAATPENPVQLD